MIMRNARQYLALTFLVFAALAAGCATTKVTRVAKVVEKKAPASPRITAPEETRYLLPAQDEPLPAQLERPVIEIHKQKRQLFLFSGDKLWRAYPVIIGRNPDDDKIREGDLCTPEGTFYVCKKNPRSKYNLSLGLSYPSIEDAERGLRDRLIDEKEYDAIVRSITRGIPPPWNTALGGEIFIHGDADFWQWTYGCVALRNTDIEELYPVIQVGTEVVIRK